MVISNLHNDNGIELEHDENIHRIVVNHKQLGVTLSSHNKWPRHMDLTNSASKQISYLRKQKFQLPKSTLNKLYYTYIRPLLE